MYNYLPLSGHIKQFNIESAMIMNKENKKYSTHLNKNIEERDQDLGVLVIKTIR